jgi:hypothetical protein
MKPHHVSQPTGKDSVELLLSISRLRAANTMRRLHSSKRDLAAALSLETSKA